MKHIFLIPFFLFSIASPAQPAVKNFECQALDQTHGTLLKGFDLSFDGTSAKISTERGVKAGGTLNPRHHQHNNEPSGWLSFIGFDDLIPEYDLTLLIPINAQEVPYFQVRLMGRGPAYFSENYICK